MRTVARLLVALALTAIALPVRGTTTVRVLVADRDNLQYMAFWVAKGAGYFAEEGVDLELTFPAAPQQAKAMMHDHAAEVAVLSPPTYLELIAEGAPVALVCNLLENDPIDLVVRKSVLAERGLDPKMPLEARLRGLKGLRIGLAPHPPSRLRALLALAGMDADRDVEMVILHGKDQIEAFRAKKVDALYTHTPFLERALVDEDATMLVNQSAGEAPTLANRQIHALLATRAYIDGRPDVLDAMARAIARAERLVRADHAAAAGALVKEFPSRDRRHIDKIVEVYAPAIPKTPEVSVDGLAPALALFPEGRKPPDLSKVDLAAHVSPQFAARASAPPAPAPKPARWLAIALAGIVALGVSTFLFSRRKRSV
jgi:NitT/TauT family transport system substrate-binding protein